LNRCANCVFYVPAVPNILFSFQNLLGSLVSRPAAIPRCRAAKERVVQIKPDRDSRDMRHLSRWVLGVRTQQLRQMFSTWQKMKISLLLPRF